MTIGIRERAAARRRRRHRRRGHGLRAPAPRLGARHHRVRGRRTHRRALPHGPGRDRGRHLQRGHRLHRPERPQLPEPRAAARGTRGPDPARADELRRLGWPRRLRMGRDPPRPLRQGRPRLRPPLPPDALRPRPVQSRGARAHRNQRSRRLAALLLPRPRLLRLLRRAADRPPGLGRLVGRPRPALELPDQLPRRVPRQPRLAAAARPPEVALGHRRIAVLRQGDHRALARPSPAVLAGSARSTAATAASRSYGTAAASTSTTS